MPDFSNKHLGVKVSHKNAIETYLGETNVTRTFNSFREGSKTRLEMTNA